MKLGTKIAKIILFLVKCNPFPRKEDNCIILIQKLRLYLTSLFNEE
jgi:hypothetical protein